MGGPLSRARTQIVTSPQVRLSHSYTFSSNVMNVAEPLLGPYYNPSTPAPQTGVGPRSGLRGTGQLQLPEIDVGDAVNGVGETATGYAANSYYRSNAFILGDSVSWVKGRHILKFGGEVRFMQMTSRPNTENMGFEFPLTDPVHGPALVNQTVFGFASFMLGDVHTGKPGHAGDVTGRRDYEALYAQDDFRISDKLTVNLGLRWEVTGPWSEKNGHWANYDNTAINPTTGVPGLLEFATAAAPRSRGRATGSSSGRASGSATRRARRRGPGVVRDLLPGHRDGLLDGRSLRLRPGFRSTNRVDPVGGGVPAFNWDNGYPGVEVPPTQDPNALPWGTTTMSPEGLKGGRIQQWNAGFDMELTRDLAVGVNYIGNTGSHLHSGDFQRNQPDMRPSNLVKSGKEWNWVSDPGVGGGRRCPLSVPRVLQLRHDGHVAVCAGGSDLGPARTSARRSATRATTRSRSR